VVDPPATIACTIVGTFRPGANPPGRPKRTIRSIRSSRPSRAARVATKISPALATTLGVIEDHWSYPG
jgi:hypothetical protein